MSGLSLRNVKKKYGSLEVIKGVNIEISEGEFCVFVGPSGCGKSTLLRMIAGLEDISGGDIEIGGRRVNDVDASKRGAAMVFQTYALYPHMTVERNMGFGLLMKGVPKAEVKAKVDKAAEILQISNLLDRKPKQLSGGQRQRVAIGRAIIREPEVFLFDEPLSNLDAELRVATRLEISKLHHALTGSTMIYVTHDQVEAMTLADKIVVLRDGLVEQAGSPMELYNNPGNLFVAGFLGSPKMNLVSVKKGMTPSGYDLRLAEGDSRRVASIGVRADALAANSEGQPAIQGEVTVVERLGDAQYVHFETSWGQELVAHYAPDARIEVGARVDLALAGKVHFFDENGDALRNIELGARSGVSA
jgi:ABC-type sugar transport system ATPase subunit